MKGKDQIGKSSATSMITQNFSPQNLKNRSEAMELKYKLAIWFWEVFPWIMVVMGSRKTQNALRK